MVCGEVSVDLRTADRGWVCPIAPSTYYDHINRSPAAASCAMANSGAHQRRVPPPTTVFTVPRKRPQPEP